MMGRKRAETGIDNPIVNGYCRVIGVCRLSGQRFQIMPPPETDVFDDEQLEILRRNANAQLLRKTLVDPPGIEVVKVYYGKQLRHIYTPKVRRKRGDGRK